MSQGEKGKPPLGLVSDAGIVGRSASELAQAIASGVWKSREVVEAHIDQLRHLADSINPLAADRFELALAESDQADAAVMRGESLGPLHGIPITIKECFACRGLPTTWGLTHRRSRCDEQDDPIVACLRQAGAIVLAKTNTSQLMFYHESDNPVYGRTLNPWNVDRVPGGSSGGEAAAIAGWGSPCGMGTDLGGSIRIPAHFCGVAGLKPTSGRLPYDFLNANFRGLEAITLQPGPMARHVADLVLLMQVLCANPTDRSSVTCPPVPWSSPDGISINGLRIGLCEDDGCFVPSPALGRAVRTAGEWLQQAGAVLVPFKPPDGIWPLKLYLQLAAADGGADLRRQLGGSRTTTTIRQLVALARIPAPLKRLAASGLRIGGQCWWSLLASAATPLTADQLWQLTAQRNAYRQRFWNSWQRQRLDAVLSPPHALAAFRHGQANDLLPAASYALWPMLLGLPAGVVPVARVSQDEERLANRSSRDHVERAATRSEIGSYGLPVGVQVMAPPWREDVTLAVMQAIEREAGFIV